MCVQVDVTTIHLVGSLQVQWHKDTETAGTCFNASARDDTARAGSVAAD
jgi:hypothetical protein